MSYKDVKPGNYKAKATAIGFAEAQSGNPYIQVEFQLQEPAEKLRWYGYLSEKTLEKTMQTLALLEYNDDETFSEGCISLDKEVSVKVELNDKDVPFVRWVNDPSRGFNNLDAATIKSKLGGINLKAEMAKARKTLGIQKVKNHAPGAEDTIPF